MRWKQIAAVFLVVVLTLGIAPEGGGMLSLRCISSAGTCMTAGITLYWKRDWV